VRKSLLVSFLRLTLRSVRNPQAAESTCLTIIPSSEAIRTGNDQLENKGSDNPEKHGQGAVEADHHFVIE
jgi:hypothetical protein